MVDFSYHEPVLLDESMGQLITDPEGVYIDLTFGGGGHSRSILDRISSRGRLLAFDRDQDTLQNIPKASNFDFMCADFRYLRNFLRLFNIKKVTGILADLGLSSHQIDTPGRGFSFRSEATLDMRMTAEAVLSAQEIFQNYPQEKLSKMFWEYGQIRKSDILAQSVVNYRDKLSKKQYSTYDLVAVVKEALGLVNPSKKLLAQVFQAFRIEANQEIESLRKLFSYMPEILSPGARLCVICYHSLETLEVKKMLQCKDIDDTPIFRKICNLKPSQSEIKKNNRARSAILRVVEKR